MHWACLLKASTDEFFHQGRRFPSLSYSRPSERSKKFFYKHAKNHNTVISERTLVIECMCEFMTHDHPDSAKVKGSETFRFSNEHEQKKRLFEHYFLHFSDKNMLVTFQNKEQKDYKSVFY